MKQEQVIAWAREVGLPPCAYDDYGNHIKNLESFAALVAAAEREACAEMVKNWNPEFFEHMTQEYAVHFIRTRALHNINKEAEKNGEEL